MSLSRILNDHPPHSPAPFSVPPPQPNTLISPRPDRSLSPPFPPREQTPTSRQALSSPALDHPSVRSANLQDVGAWDPDTSDWRHSSRPRNGNTDVQREGSPNSVQEHHYSKNEEPNSANKKRKRAANDDGDYRPPTSRRVSPCASCKTPTFY
jgi:hypothetical protein